MSRINQGETRGREPVAQLAVFEWALRQFRPVTARDVSEVFGYTIIRAREILAELVRRGVLARCPPEEGEKQPVFVVLEAFNTTWAKLSREEIHKIRDNVLFAIRRQRAEEKEWHERYLAARRSLAAIDSHLRLRDFAREFAGKETEENVGA